MMVLNAAEARANLQRGLDEHLSGIASPRILEAGCGSTTNLRLPPDSHITGIDISKRELEANRNLSARALGDLQTYNFEPEQFDLVVCWDVLEHLEAPLEAMKRMAVALRPGGLLLIKVPNRNSLKAWTVRATPYWFHRLVYRFLYQQRFGKPGIIPFHTHFREAMAPRAIEEFAMQMTLQSQFATTYESGVQARLRRRLRINDRLLAAIERVANLISFGRLTIASSECVYLLGKAEASQQPDSSIERTVGSLGRAAA
ncbi:MAG: class I SAM-dependent methyltransferase [Terriglobales bacterium]